MRKMAKTSEIDLNQTLSQGKSITGENFILKGQVGRSRPKTECPGGGGRGAAA